MELHRRKQATESAMEQRSKEKRKLRDQLMSQPEREDERLTRPSVPKSWLPKVTGALPDPNRKKRLALSRARVEYAREKKDSQLKNSLHTLYMNARGFITTEKQLAAEIDRVFPEGNNEAWKSDQGDGENVWNLGLPPAVETLVNDPKRNQTARWDMIQERVKKLGEEITGGKM